MATTIRINSNTAPASIDDSIRPSLSTRQVSRTTISSRNSSNNSASKTPALDRIKSTRTPSSSQCMFQTRQASDGNTNSPTAPIPPSAKARPHPSWWPVATGSSLLSYDISSDESPQQDSNGSSTHSANHIRSAGGSAAGSTAAAHINTTDTVSIGSSPHRAGASKPPTQKNQPRRLRSAERGPLEGVTFSAYEAFQNGEFIAAGGEGEVRSAEIGGLACAVKRQAGARPSRDLLLWYHPPSRWLQSLIAAQEFEGDAWYSVYPLAAGSLCHALIGFEVQQKEQAAKSDAAATAAAKSTAAAAAAAPTSEPAGSSSSGLKGWLGSLFGRLVGLGGGNTAPARQDEAASPSIPVALLRALLAEMVVAVKDLHDKDLRHGGEQGGAGEGVGRYALGST